MNTLSLSISRFRPALPNPFRLAFCLLAWSVASLFGADDGASTSGSGTEGGRIAGRVQHAVTGSFLNGAAVEIVGLGRSTLSDPLGRFEFRNLPSGEHTVVVSYTGLDTEQRSVRVGADDSMNLLIAMQSEVLRLESFQVTTEAEGHAAAITRQRNSPNLITAAATDAFGALASQNPGEIFMRLPGVAATIDDDGQPSAVSIRGMASRLNSVTMDGGMLAPVSSGATRQVRFTTNSTAQFEELEIVKGIRPDMEGSSIGGTLNMKTKSPLSTTRDHEFRYKIGGRWAPPFTPHNPIRGDRRLHADLSASYIGVFNVFGGKRNLAVSLNSTFFESVGDYARTIRDYEFTTNPRAYVWDYQVADYYFNRILKTFSGRVDYQLTEHTILSFRGALNKYDAWGGHLFNQARAFTGRTIAALDGSGNPIGNGAILPNYTETRTEVRPVAASQFSLSSNSIGQLQTQESLQLVLDHKKDRWDIEVSLNYALGRLDQLSGQNTSGGNGGSFTATVPTVGYVIDLSDSQKYPAFTQTAGPSVYDINNYRNGTLIQTGSRRDAHIYSAKADVKFDLDLNVPTYLKTGVNFRRQDSDMTTHDDRSLLYVGPDGSVGTSDDTLAPFRSDLVLSDDYRMGELPLIDVKKLAQNLRENPASWQENVYYAESRRYSGTNLVEEDVSAAYLMASAKLGKLTALGGVRYERTDVSSNAWVIQRTRADITDPVLRAATEYSRRTIEGSYDHTLPSLHLSYSFLPNLIARASYSEGLGRPEFSNLVPREQVNDTAQTVTVSNPSLLPQSATNWDLGLEYYMKPMGVVSVSVFQKDLEEFIFTAANGTVGSGSDNGFGGQYEGYTINTTLNGGSAKVKGLELSYQQQLNFGPRWVRNIGLFANYTKIEASGDYGSSAPQTGVTQLAEFVPETWNLGFRFSRGRFRANYLVNYTGEYLFSYSADPSRLRYKNPFTQTTISASWALRPSLELYLDGYNIYNKSQSYYYGVPGHLQAYSIKGMIVSFGLRGRF